MKNSIKVWKKLKEIHWKGKTSRILVLLFLAGAVCLLDSRLCYPSKIPDIVFMCTKYSEVTKEKCELTFIDKHGKCYYSDDPYVCNSSHEDLINAYRAGELEDKIKSCGSCSRYAVIKRYRKMYRLFKKKKIRSSVNLGALWPCVLTNQWDWHWLYFEGSGEVQCFVFHTKKFGRAYYSTDNKQVNQIYEWCEDVMGIDV